MTDLNQTIVFVEKLVADGGGDVFYHVIKKSDNILNQKDIMMRGITSLLDEAKKAKMDDDWQQEKIMELEGLDNPNRAEGTLEDIVMVS